MKNGQAVHVSRVAVKAAHSNVGPTQLRVLDVAHGALGPKNFTVPPTRFSGVVC